MTLNDEQTMLRTLMGINETMLYEMYSRARARVVGISERITLSNELTDEQRETLNKVWIAEKENYVNAVDEICARYLDGKADAGRLREQYAHIVVNTFEDEAMKPVYDGSPYAFRATRAVYETFKSYLNYAKEATKNNLSRTHD